ncbi:alx [Symbiodinium natans]|uniref:Alx protein n=1 Tax=Symbiodinium natans TaxID=878477 RepID=A0A812NC77_9DINO|nr:alx [Symbiodinium natans]
MAPWLLLDLTLLALLCWPSRAGLAAVNESSDTACHTPNAVKDRRMAGNLLNSAPLLLQKPGAHVSLLPANGSLAANATRQSWQLLPDGAPPTAMSGQNSVGVVINGTRAMLSRFGSWARHASLAEVGPTGIHQFFNSALLLDWCLFLSMALAAAAWRQAAAGRGLVVALAGWISLGAAYAVAIFALRGPHHGSNWLAGYLLELIFLTENVFVFHAIAEAFQLSRAAVSGCLVVVAWGQVMFDAVFFMGLAAWLRSWILLPYLLGSWLLCLGLYVLSHSHEEPGLEASVSPADSPCASERSGSPAADMVRNVTGNRVAVDTQDETGYFVVKAYEHLKVSVLDVATATLLLADFVLDIDVVLTKIEEIPNTYLAFSSSAMAAFLIPELFALSQDMLYCFPLLHYGIGVVLCFFGLQILFAWAYEIQPLVACSMVVVILAACVPGTHRPSI